MAIGVRSEEEPAEIEIASVEDVRRSVAQALDSLGVTFNELNRQAMGGQFANDRARLTWMAIRNIARA